MERVLSPCLEDEPQDGNGYQTGILFPHSVSDQATTDIIFRHAAFLLFKEQLFSVHLPYFLWECTKEIVDEDIITTKSVARSPILNQEKRLIQSLYTRADGRLNNPTHKVASGSGIRQFLEPVSSKPEMGHSFWKFAITDGQTIAEKSIHLCPLYIELARTHIYVGNMPC